MCGDVRIGRLKYIPPPGMGWIWNDEIPVIVSSRAIANAIRAVVKESLCRATMDHGFFLSNLEFDAGNTEMDASCFGTLQQTAALEAWRSKRGGNTSNADVRYDICAEIAAVSPILNMEDSTPFAIMELGDSSSQYRAICILKGTALAACELPCTTCIGVRQVQRQRWKIPMFVSNSPVSVFVMEQLHQIVILEEITTSEQLQGTIVSVHWLVGKQKEQRQLHYFELSNDIFLYVTYFPMSKLFQRSLTVGTQIVARGLTQIGHRAYGANVRSQLHIVKASGESHPYSSIRSYIWQKQIKMSYQTLCFKRQLASLLASVHHQAFQTNVPSVSDFMESMGLSPMPSKRNPYVEFLTPKEPNVAPSTISLSQLRDDAMTQLLERLQRHGETNIGWNASFGCWDDCDNRTTLGYLRARVKSGVAFGRLSDGHSETPLVMLSIPEIPQHPGYSWVTVQDVFVSCVCIYDAVANYDAPKHQFLPWSFGDAMQGAAALVLVNGRLYAASVLIIARSIRPVGDFYPTTTTPVPSSSIFDCLQSSGDLPDRPIQGMLVRSWWTATKLKSKVFHGVQLTMGHSDNANECPLQSIDFKPRVVVDGVQSLVDRVVAFTEGCDIPLDHLSLGAVWWKLADDATLASILIGGWDDCQFPNDECSKVLVWIPPNCVEQDQKRGFVRVRCVLDDLTFALRTTNRNPPTTDGTLINKAFLFESRDAKFVIGMQDIRPKRLGLHREIVTSTNDIPGVPTQSIGRIFIDLMDDLRTQSRFYMRPSLVRAIPKATFLGVSFCRALASCSKCHSELRQPKRKRMHAVVRGHHHTTTLVCPDGCDVHQFGTVKWECSGTLDDSTGQAKLYAERDTALCLIGITNKVRSYIEEGVWRSDGNLVFSKTVPPKSHLKHAVESARSTAKQNLRFDKHQSTGNRRLSEEDVLRQMNPIDRAEYLMEWVCRCQPRSQAHRLFLVRCKPLADAVSHVGQAEVQLANENRTTSYTLPPLKLILVDCVKLV